MAARKCEARPAGKAERANCFFTNTIAIVRSRHAEHNLLKA